jgi:hypothetical protein
MALSDNSLDINLFNKILLSTLFIVLFIVYLSRYMGLYISVLWAY